MVGLKESVKESVSVKDDPSQNINILFQFGIGNQFANTFGKKV